MCFQKQIHQQIVNSLRLERDLLVAPVASEGSKLQAVEGRVSRQRLAFVLYAEIFDVVPLKQMACRVFLTPHSPMK